MKFRFYVLVTVRLSYVIGKIFPSVCSLDLIPILRSLESDLQIYFDSPKSALETLLEIRAYLRNWYYEDCIQDGHFSNTMDHCP